MKKRVFNLIKGVSDLFFGFVWLCLAYFILGKPMCNGGEVTLMLIIPFILVGIGCLILGVIRLRVKCC